MRCRYFAYIRKEKLFGNRNKSNLEEEKKEEKKKEEEEKKTTQTIINKSENNPTEKINQGSPNLGFEELV